LIAEHQGLVCALRAETGVGSNPCDGPPCQTSRRSMNTDLCSSNQAMNRLSGDREHELVEEINFALPAS
jgi:hypothetical protein